MLEKANRPDPNNPAEAQSFREHADKLMKQYEISEEECRPQERVRPQRPSSDSTDWMRDYLNNLWRQAQRDAEEQMRQEKEARARAQAERIKTTQKIMNDVQAMGEAFVPDELIVAADRWEDQTIESFLRSTFSGWELFTERDPMRAGYWIRTEARDAEARERRAKERAEAKEAKRKAQERLQWVSENRWQSVGDVSEEGIFSEGDETIIDDLGEYLDDVNRKLKRFDHKFCVHPKTTQARRKCREARERSGF
jgi:Protein of unknown function (DUF2786)